jgi:hypothetical protein
VGVNRFFSASGVEHAQHNQRVALFPAKLTGFPLIDAALFGIALSVSAAFVLGVIGERAVTLPVCLISLAFPQRPSAISSRSASCTGPSVCSV